MWSMDVEKNLKICGEGSTGYEVLSHSGCWEKLMLSLRARRAGLRVGDAAATQLE